MASGEKLAVASVGLGEIHGRRSRDRLRSTLPYVWQHHVGIRRGTKIWQDILATAGCGPLHHSHGTARRVCGGSARQRAHVRWEALVAHTHLGAE